MLFNLDKIFRFGATPEIPEVNGDTNQFIVDVLKGILMIDLNGKRYEITDFIKDTEKNILDGNVKIDTNKFYFATDTGVLFRRYGSGMKVLYTPNNIQPNKEFIIGMHENTILYRKIVVEEGINWSGDGPEGEFLYTTYDMDINPNIASSGTYMMLDKIINFNVLLNKNGDDTFLPLPHFSATGTPLLWVNIINHDQPRVYRDKSLAVVNGILTFTVDYIKKEEAFMVS